MRPALIYLLALVFIGSGCSGKRDPKELLGPTGGGTIVVDARLMVGEPVPIIRLRLTQAPDRSFRSTPLRNANVVVFTLAGDSTHYFDLGDGDYHPLLIPSSFVQPRTTYFLRVEAPDGRVVTAETTTPDTFRVHEWVLLDAGNLTVRRILARPSDFSSGAEDSVFLVNQLIYQDGIVEARFDRGSALGFQMALFSLDASAPLVIDADFLSEAEKADLAHESSSPPLDAPDGFTRLPWLAVWYEGPHRFVVYSVDRNWYDIARSVRFYGPSGLGFGSNAGDDFERPIFHIEGGIGLFGSAAYDETYFDILPRP